MNRVERAAERLVSKAGIATAPVPVEEIAREYLGIEVVRERLENGVSGMLYRRDEAKPIIVVNSSHASVRQRFTIAHELGHHELHPGRSVTVDHLIRARVNLRDNESSLATNREEIEANGFGAALLMPADYLHLAVENRLGTSSERLVQDLAQLFDVSTQAMALRLINLGIRAAP